MPNWCSKVDKTHTHTPYTDTPHMDLDTGEHVLALLCLLCRFVLNWKMIEHLLC